MLRTTTGLSRVALRWVSQVAASLGATLAATLIWAAVPHPGDAAPPQPELTTGGKFAARAVAPAAYDGLDTMPLPRVAPIPAAFVVAAPPLAVAPDRPAHPARAVRPPLRTEARHAEPALRPAATTQPAVAVAAAEPAEAASEAGLLPRILPALTSTARDAWAYTASAGDRLVARVVPQIP